MQSLTAPASKDELTNEWLQSVLAHSLVSMTGQPRLTRIGEAYGFASQLFRCRWQAEGSPNSVVVKLWATDSKAGTGEIRFYETFGQAVGCRIPLCYHAAADPNTQRGVLVLEDLQDAVQGDCLELLNLDRAKSVARSLAGLHTTWLEHTELAEFPWLPESSHWTLSSEWFQSRRNLFLERFGKTFDGVAEALLAKLELAPKLVNEHLTSAPRTLLHGDFHLDNIMFERQTEPVLLDWSRPIKGPLVLNLAKLLFAMTPLQNFDEVLTHYLETFNSKTRKPLSSTDIEKQLGGAFLRKFTLSTLAMVRSQMPPPRGPQLLEMGFKQASQAADFWYERDPELFSFLD